MPAIKWMLHFEEKCGKSREFPVGHDLKQMLFEHMEAAGLRNARKDVYIFRTAERKTGRLTKKQHVRCRRVPHGQARAQGRKPPDASFAALFEKESHNNFSRGQPNHLYQ